MIKISTATTAHNSDLASYASSYSMAENNFSNRSQIPGDQLSDRDSNNDSDNDQSRPKKVCLPSISSIASSLRQPLSFSNSSTTSPSFPTITYTQRTHSNPELNKLHAAAEIFTKSYNNESLPGTQNGKPGSHASSPMTQHQQVVFYPQQQQQQQQQLPPQPYTPQYHQLPPPPGQAVQVQHGQSFAPYPQPSSANYYIPHSMESVSHYTTTTQHHLNAHHIKPKRNYTRRLSKVQQENKLKPQLYCQRCGITETPEWRKGPNGARTLCNACGLFHAKILKRDGPEAAANAINSNKVVKKNTFKRRSSVNDAPMIPNYQTVPPQVAQQQPFPGAPVQILPPPPHLYQQQQQQQQQQQVILPPGVQPLAVPQPHGISPFMHNNAHYPHQQDGRTGVVLSPISPVSIHHSADNKKH